MLYVRLLLSDKTQHPFVEKTEILIDRVALLWMS